MGGILLSTLISKPHNNTVLKMDAVNFSCVIIFTVCTVSMATGEGDGPPIYFLIPGSLFVTLNNGLCIQLALMGYFREPPVSNKVFSPVQIHTYCLCSYLLLEKRLGCRCSGNPSRQ